MCLALPGKIVSIEGDAAVVDYGGVSRRADVSLIENPAVGSWVLVHAGFAIQLVDDIVAKGMYRLLDGVDER